MVAVVHYQSLPPMTGSVNELIRYKCEETPCVHNDVVITSVALDTHAEKFHNASYIEVRPVQTSRPGPDEADGELEEEMQSPT